MKRLVKGRRRGIVVAASAVLVLALTACQPYFGGGATLTATALGPLVTLSWTAATEDDAGQFVHHYGIEVNGVEVATTATSATSCVLTGLSANTTYNLSVTAYGNTGEWSGSYNGSLASMARVSKSYTTPATGSAGATKQCVPTTDSDGDRLPDAVETNNGNFQSAAATGTNPNLADTDGDRISDGDEVLGTTAGLNLPGMAIKPTKKDILIEADWFDDSLECGAHSHRPTDAAVTRLKTAFASSPVTNPDGTTGVNIVVDKGQGGVFTGGTVVPDADGVLSLGVNSNEFVAIKNANFAANRVGYFHYVLLPHRYNQTSGSSGQAELPGNDLIVSLYCANSDTNVANTIMHELGHNLGLHHGGNVDTNYKPNYNSVMNYQFQFPGIDTNCNAVGDGTLSYSVGTRISLNESALTEANGVCGPGTTALDWNGNSTIDSSPVSVDINGDAAITTLQDFNDWAALNFNGINDIDGANPNAVPQKEIVTEQDVPPGF